MPNDRIAYKSPAWQQLAYIAGPGSWIDDSSPTVLEPGDVLDLGTSAAGAAGNAEGFSVAFASNFDDSVYDTLRLWITNAQILTGHDIKAQFAADQVGEATQTTALTTGTVVSLPTQPYHADAKISTATVANVYDSTNKWIETIVIQSNPAGGATPWDYADEYLSNPGLVLEIPRVDDTTTRLRAGYSGLDLADGQLFTFSEVKLFEVLVSGSTEYWQLRAAIKDQSFTLKQGTEVISWDKYKPAATVHQAISTVMSEVTFQIDNEAPGFIASAFDEVAIDNATDQTVDIPLTAVTRPPIYTKYVVQWVTQGGFIARMVLPKCHLSATGDYVPGGDDFAGYEFSLKALVNNTSAKSLCTTKCTRIPMEQIVLPFTYAVT